MQRPFKPASKAAKSAALNGPAHIWNLIIACGASGFTVTQLEKATSATARSTVKSYVLACLEQGLVERASLAPRKKDGTFGRRKYVITAAGCALRKAPVRRRDDYTGERGRARQHMWNAMRFMRSFSNAELHIAASTEDVTVTFANARAYVAALRRAGLIVDLQVYAKGKPGKKPGAAAGLYRLKPSANTGPLPLKVMCDGVFDPNTQILIRYPGSDTLPELPVAQRRAA